MLRHISFILFFVLLGLTAQVQGSHSENIPESNSEIVRLVLDRLYHSIGNYQVDIPEVRIVGTEELVAAYHPNKHIIYIEEKAIDVCRSFGNQSLDALAFLLGHELTHAYQKLGWATNFMAYDRVHNKSVEHEKMADIQGAFGATLAEFNTLAIIHPLIERLYDAYELKGLELSGYPSFAERKATAEDVRESVGRLWNIYQHANHLTVLGDYKIASLSYEYILDYYIGKEIYNNLGTLYARLAMTFCGKNNDPYIYPFELNANSRLRDTRAEELTPIEIQEREELLENADRFFEQALQLDKNYVQAYINQLAVRTQSGDYKKVIQLRESGKIFSRLRRMRASQHEQADANMIVAIAYGLSGEKNTSHMNSARRLLQQLAQSQDIEIQNIAGKNLALLSGKKVTTPKPNECHLAPTSSYIDGATPLKYMRSKANIILDNQERQDLFIKELDNSVVFVSRNGSNRFVVQQITTTKYQAIPEVGIGTSVRTLLGKTEEKEYNVFPAGDKYYIHFPGCRMLFLLDQKDRIQSWIKYFN